ncbi:MAG TPA: hypothetical protein VFD76_10595 [Gemmatimonadales bacterium]|nr:hypothetical protein [Gemmatimonadales bacterium]
MTQRSRLVAATAALTGIGLLAVGCGNSNGLPGAVFTNVLDTVSLYALRGTALQQPSGYALFDTTLVRTDQSISLDFAFDFDTATHTPSLYPTGALSLGTGSGLQKTTTDFATITLAPTGGYVYDKPAVLDTGTVLYVASRPMTCTFGSTVPLYAKLRVLGVDTTARRLDFEILVNQNCGYRSLATGLPKQ